MFRIAKPDETYPTPVTVRAPDGGETVDAQCTLHFKCLPSDEAGKLALAGNAAFLRKVVTGWDDIAGTNGNALPFTKKNLEALLQIPYFAASAVDAYFERFHLRKNF